MGVATAYGVGIAGNLSLDALHRTSSTLRTIHVAMQRLSSIKEDPGISIRPCNAQGRIVHIVAHDEYVAVQVEALLSFKLWLSANRVDCNALDTVSEAHVAYWILQQILPLFLLLDRSTEFLHGMAISALPAPVASQPSGCVAFLGESHAGKSTLLSYFLAQQHALVTDDHLALSRKSYTTVLPAPPFYRPYRAAEDLGVPAATYSAEPTQLQRLYLLEPAPPDAPIHADRLTGMAAVAALFPNLHYSLHNPKAPDFFPLVADRFHGLADMVRKVPFARLHVPRSLARLSEVYAFIQQDQQS